MEEHETSRIDLLSSPHTNSRDRIRCNKWSLTAFASFDLGQKLLRCGEISMLDRVQKILLFSHDLLLAGTPPVSLKSPALPLHLHTEAQPLHKPIPQFCFGKDVFSRGWLSARRLREPQATRYLYPSNNHVMKLNRPCHSAFCLAVDVKARENWKFNFVVRIAFRFSFSSFQSLFWVAWSSVSGNAEALSMLWFSRLGGLERLDRHTRTWKRSRQEKQ